MSADSWFKVQAGRSEGLVSERMRSDDGGFGFYGYDDLSFTDAERRRLPRRPQRRARRLLRRPRRPPHALYADARRRLLGAGLATLNGHRALRRHVQDAGDGAPEPRGQGRSADRGPGARDHARIELDVGLPADRRMERQHRRAQRPARGPFAGRAADAGAGRAHGRGRAGRRSTPGAVMARLRLRPGHAVASTATARTTGASARAAPIASPSASGSTRRSPTATSGPAADSAPTTCIPSAPTCT